jgi:carboxypeptidase T
MKKLSFRKWLAGLGLFALFTSVPLSSNQASVAPSRYRFYVEADSRSHLRRLAGWLNANEFDIAGVDLKRGTLEVLTGQPGIEFLKSKGMTGRLVLVPVVGGKQTNLSDLDNRYLDPVKVAAKMDEIHARYPDVTRVLEIGRSLENRPILALVVSTTPDIADPRFHGKPTLLFDGMHHAREIMTPEIVFDVGESILGAARRSADARLTLESMNVVLVPMLNVDGNARVWSSDTMWRKNARGEGASTFGVDINRNYSFRWNGCHGSSGSRGAQDYRGASAASEPETRALMELADRVHPMASVS